MRIVIDLQAAQGAQRFDASGRHALALARAIARQRGQHELVIALNGAFAETIEPLRAAFHGLLPVSAIRVWYGSIDAGESQFMAASVREAFLAALAPDVVLVAQFAAGFADASVTSLGEFVDDVRTAVLLHDVTPWREPALVTEPVPGLAQFYKKKYVQLQHAAQWLTLDAGVARDAQAVLGRAAHDLSADVPATSSGQDRWDTLGRAALAALASMAAAPVPVRDAEALLRRVIARLPAALVQPLVPDHAAQWAHQLSKFPQQRPRRLFIDVSVMVELDARTGVQRVTRSVLQELLAHPPAGYEVVPVYGEAGQPGLRYANRFKAKFLHQTESMPDAPIDYQSGDVFVGLDLSPQVLPAIAPFLQAMRRDGVSVQIVVYDLLPVLMPQYFPPGTAEGHAAWLRTALSFDGVVCISRAVAWEVTQWARDHAPARLRPCAIGWFHLGADVDGSVPSRGMPPDADFVLEQLAKRPTLLGVGTVEPRKHYEQILDAFELLWRDGVDVNLVIVGKQGWMTEALAQRLHSHAENGRRLFWLAGISDEYLTRVYGVASGLIAASTGEGFGLPLIEAARHHLPVIARDLPVFREVGGERAYYFSGLRPQDLADAVAAWLELLTAGGVPSSEGMARMTWQQSTQQLMQVVLGQEGHAAQLLDSPASPARLRPRVLMLSPYPLRRSRHGGQLRAAAMARVYEAAGFDVHSVGFYQAEAYEEADIGHFDVAFPPDSPFRQFLGVPMPALSDFLMGPFAVNGDQVYRQVVDGLPGAIDVIQVEQTWLYPLACWLRLQAPQCRNALIVNSTHNVEAHMKRAILADQYTPALIDHVVGEMAALERDAAREADLSLAVTAGDAAVLDEYGAPRVVHAPNGISPWSAAPDRRAAWRARLPKQPWPIFIASAHPPNYTGFLDAIGDTLACIPEGSKLVVAGGVGPHLQQALGKSRWRDLNLARLQILGVLEDADLAAVKSLAHAFLLPIGAGGGSNIKTAEALYSGKPVICTPTAMRGFEHFAHLPEVTVADTPAQFQAAIRAVLEAAPSDAAGAVSDLRASLTWDACLGGVPVVVRDLLQQDRTHP